MIFSSHVFVFLFLPLVLVGYYLLGKCREAWPSRLLLALSSLFFYGYFNWIYLLLIVLSIGVNATAGRWIPRWENRWPAKVIVGIAILFNLGLLGYFKYAGFFINNMNAVFDLGWTAVNIVLPLGISFFTFQQIAYVWEIYTGKLRARYSLISYTLFVCYFPQLIAGPIVLPEEMMPQFDDPANRRLQFPNLAAGLWLFSVGMAKKLIIADYFAVLVGKGFGTAATQPIGDAWMAVLAFSIQIYFDFSAYSDMALGLGRMFNIKLPNNFQSPYKSASIKEFWATWHITLGRFFATYLYFPLGGNRKGRARTLLNLFVVAFLCGLWHGAGWFYIIWGTLHGLAMVCHRVWSDMLHLKMPRILGVAVTFLFILLVGALFRCENYAQFKALAYSLFHWTAGTPVFADFSWNLCWATAAVLFVIFFMKNAVGKLENFRITRWRIAETVFFTVASVFCMSRISPFIYFNF